MKKYTGQGLGESQVHGLCVLSPWIQARHTPGELMCSPTRKLIWALCAGFLFFLPHHSACGILVPRPGIEPTPLAVEAWSLNQWTAREVLCAGVLLGCRYIGWTDWIINHMNKLHLQPPSPPWRSGWYCIAQGSNPLIKWLEVLAEAELVSTPMWSERSTMNNNDSPVTGEIPRV